MTRTLVDFAVPENAEPAPSSRPPVDALVPPPVSSNAPIARRTTGPVLLPDEAGISVDMPIVPGGPLVPEADSVDVTDPAAPAPIGAADSLEEPPSVDEPAAPAETVEEPEAAEAEAVDEDGLQVTERISTVDVQAAAAAAAAEAEAESDAAPESAPEAEAAPEPERAPEPAVAAEPEPADDEEEEFGEFVLPADPDQSDESADGILPTDSADIEIASPEDSLADAINDFASDAEDDIRIEPASDAPAHGEELEDELELSTSDMHVVDMEVEVEVEPEPEPEEPASTAPAIRAIPPPLPSVSVSYVLRPFSEDSARRKVVPIGADAVVIGREDGDVPVTDGFVSPRHARFSVHEATLYVDDLDSLNGVWLRVREETTIDADDELLVGQQVLRIERTVARPENGATDDGTRRYGPSAGHATYRVVQIASDGQPLDRYHVAPGGSRIGRRLGDIVFTDDTYMSGTHVLLMPRSGTLLVRDLSSRNGCWVRVRGRQALDTGDAVMIGRTVWRVGRPVA